MAEQTRIISEVETPEAFLADRERFWHAFTQATIGAAVLIAIILIGMRLFLL